MKSRRVRHQQGGHATHGHPHQHLVAGDHTESGAQPTPDAALLVEVMSARLPGPGMARK